MHQIPLYQFQRSGDGSLMKNYLKIRNSKCFKNEHFCICYGSLYLLFIEEFSRKLTLKFSKFFKVQVNFRFSEIFWAALSCSVRHSQRVLITSKFNTFQFLEEGGRTKKWRFLVRKSKMHQIPLYQCPRISLGGCMKNCLQKNRTRKCQFLQLLCIYFICC